MIDCYLMLADIVGYSKLPQSEQVDSVSKLLNEWTNSCTVLNDDDKNKCTTISIGDGFIAIMPHSYSNSPIEAIFDFLNRADKEKLSLHVGMHYGACEPIVLDDNQLTHGVDISNPEINNYLGYNVNYVARLASCAKSKQRIASAEFINRVESYSGSTFNKEEIKWDEFIATFKGDVVRIKAGDRPIILPSGNLMVAQDKRQIYNILIQECRNILSPPDKTVSFSGANNYHDTIAFHPTNFQLRPDLELYSLYNMESKIANVITPPFLSRLPYSLIYSIKTDGPIKRIKENHIKNVTLEIESGSIDKLLGEPPNNSEQCCLRSYDFKEGICTLGFSRCFYKESRASNMAPDRCVSGLMGGDSLRTKLLADNKGYLPNLDCSDLTNNIGVSAIVISRGRFVILQPRGEKGLHSNINSLSAGASGAVDWIDFSDDDKDLILKPKSGDINVSHAELSRLFGRRATAVDRGILRECTEEIGLLPNEIESIQLIGIAREFRRIGKPEFFYIVKTLKSVEEHQNIAENQADDAWEYNGKKLKRDEPLPKDLSGQIEYFANRVNDHRYNEITQMSFYFMIEYLLSAP